MKEGKTSKFVNLYTENLTAELISIVSDYAIFDQVTDIQNDKMFDRVQCVLIKETMDIQEVN